MAHKHHSSQVSKHNLALNGSASNQKPFFFGTMLLAFTLLAFLPLTNGAKCSFEIPNKWGSGCQVAVKFDKWTPNEKFTVELGSGGKLGNVWGAKLVATNGNSLTFALNKWEGSLGMIIRGTDNVEVPTCSGDSGAATTVATTTTAARVTTTKNSAETTTKPALATTKGSVVTTTKQAISTTTSSQCTCPCNFASTKTTGQAGTTRSTADDSASVEGLLKPTIAAKSGKDRLEEYVKSLSTTVGSNSLGTIRVIQSSGGAAGGVISEGQGYGLLLAGQVAAATGDSNAIKYAVEIFNGWKEMCKKSKDDKSCQGGKYYCDGNPCLPHWKFSSDMSSAQGTGAAPDGDEDAILGMILLLSATDSSSLSAWDDVAEWTYQSCKAFMDVNTVGGTGEMLKLGSCWGGWDCSNPSYFSPGHYRAMRDFMKKYKSKYGGSDPDYTAKWNKLITISYEIMQANQCEKTGLVTNWWKPDKSNPSSGGTTSGCSGSGTPSAEFGAEASRTIWRFVLDYIWYASEATEGLGAATFAKRVAKHATTKFASGSNLNVGCKVTSIHSGWLDNDFLWAPTASSFVVDAGVAGQQEALDKAVTKINGRSINDYYAGSWVALVTEVFNGETEKAGQKLKAALN